jgi:hypothetical protein
LKTIILSWILAGCLMVTAAQGQEHYCDEPKQWAEWQTAVEQHPEDDDLLAAYVLRIGLCQQIKAGKLETDRAVHIFEDFMAALVRKSAKASQKSP